MVVTRFEKLVHTGIDYITATSTNRNQRKRLRTLAEIWLGEERADGNDCREWQGHGYEGLACGSIQFGERHDSTLVRVTGATAHDNVVQVLRLATNVSRLDLQSTVLIGPPGFRFAEFAERRALMFKEQSEQRHAVRLLRDSKTGNTCYVGRRVSDRFIRVYDKGSESRLPELRDCWRAEVQYNNKLAWSMSKRLATSCFDRKRIHWVVHQELSRKGIPWLPALRVPEVSIKGVPVTYRCDSAQRLAWLCRQVGPSVKRELVLGHRDEVLRALGLGGPLEEGQ